MSAPLSAPPAQWTDYVQVSDVLGWLGLPADTSNGTLQLIVSMACDWVQSFLAKPIAPTQMFHRFDGWSGWNGAYLMLPYYPIISVDSVVEYRGTSGAYTLTESTPAAQTDGYQVEKETGRLTRVFPGLVQRPWFPGSANVEITWTAGYETVPPKVMVATVELVKHWWENAINNRGVGGAPSAGSDYDPAEGGTGMFAAVPYRITSLLAPLNSVGIG